MREAFSYGIRHISLWFNKVWPYASLNHNGIYHIPYENASLMGLCNFCIKCTLSTLEYVVNFAVRYAVLCTVMPKHASAISMKFIWNTFAVPSWRIGMWRAWQVLSQGMGVLSFDLIVPLTSKCVVMDDRSNKFSVTWCSFDRSMNKNEVYNNLGLYLNPVTPSRCRRIGLYLKVKF